MLTFAVATYLHGLGLVTFKADGSIDGDCFIDHMPPQPDTAVAITLYGALPQRSSLPYDLPTVQLRARGPKHRPDAPLQLLERIYSELHGLDGVRLTYEVDEAEHEIWVVGCTAQLSASSYIGQDENGRHERTQNFDFHVHSPTVHRPAITV